MELCELVRLREKHTREAWDAIVAEKKPAPDVFLCHSSREKSFVRRLASDLDRLAVRPWLDAWELGPGTHCWTKLAKA